MATITPTAVSLGNNLGTRGIAIHQWACVLAADTYSPIEIPAFADRTVQASGTWAAGTVVIQGSIDGTTYKTLTDPQGNPLSFTADSIEAVAENVRYIRPAVTTNVTGVTVSILFRG